MQHQNGNYISFIHTTIITTSHMSLLANVERNKECGSFLSASILDYARHLQSTAE